MWIKTYEAFEKNDIPIVLANPLKTGDSRGQKDKVDSRTLADLRRTDFIPQCHVSTLKIRDQKQLLRHRESLVRDRTKIANRMNTLLDKYDMQTIGNRITGVKNLQWLNEQIANAQRRSHTACAYNR